MKQLTTLFILLFVISSSFAEANVRSLDNFNELRVGEGINVKLFRGESNSATVTVNNGAESDIKTTVENGILRITWKKGSNNNRSANVDLYYTKLNNINASSAANVSSNQALKSKDISLKSSSGAKVKLELICTNLVAKVSSGSNMVLSGEAKNQQVDISAGGSYKSEDLISESAVIEATSGAMAKVHVSKSIEAEASTGASIKYTGNPANKEIEESEYTGGSISEF